MLERNREAVVIGAGPAGLGAAGQLRRRGLEVVVLEAAEAVATSWRGRYLGLRLNSVRWLTGIPGTPIPRSTGRWPSREDYVAYLERYATDQELDIRFGIEAQRVDRDGEHYLVTTSEGTVRARYVVVATGYDREPVIPDWPGRDEFAGDLLHSSRYRDPKPFRGKEVLVVGTGNTGTEVSTQLARGGAARVRVAVRTGKNIFPRTVWGLPITAWGRMSALQPAWFTDRMGRVMQRSAWGGDLSEYGMPRPPHGIATELRVTGLGAVVDGGFVAALKEGAIEVVPAVERFEGTDVVLADCSRLSPDVVIAATGYRHGLEGLVGHLGVLSDAGRPLVMGGETHPEAPRLYFNGYWLPLYGQLTAMRRTSRQIGRAVARDRRRRACSRHRSHTPRLRELAA